MSNKKDDGVTLETVQAVSQLRAAEANALANDNRPRSTPVKIELGEGLQCCRWGAQQVHAIRERLKGIGHESNTITADDSNRGHCIKVVQIGLRRDTGRLAFPGDDGFNALGRLTNAELSRLASQALTFNEVF